MLWKSRAFRVTLVTGLSLLAGQACVIGPGYLPKARYGFNEAIAQSWNQQLLLNLVRLRYRDNPVFLEVGSIVSSISMSASTSAGAHLTTGDARTWEYNAGGGIGWSESPTVTYSPLQGEEFTNRLLTPISPNVLVLLSQSGWSVERLFLCCVQRVNGLTNALGASGPTPSYVPSHEDFRRVAALFRELQVRERLFVDAEGEGATETLRMRFILPALGDSADNARVEEIRQLLGLDPSRAEFRIVSALAPRSSSEIAISPRSLLSVLFFLSQAVEVPPAHAQAGWVTTTRNEDGTPFDWDLVLGDIFRVRVSDSEPREAAVRVPYRGQWFWIADDDLSSKTTFSLLTYLFSLKAGSQDLRQPLLTLGVR
jgi:hypothetical protein